MSGPRRKRSRIQKRAGLTRRSFLKGLGLGTASVSGLSLLQACGSDDNNSSSNGSANPSDTAPTQNVQFLHSVASGDPAFDSVVLWTRITPDNAPENADNTVAGRVDVFNDEALTSFVKSINFETSAAQDFTVKLVCNGLQQDTVYFYQFRSNGKTSPVGRTRTTPAAGNKRPLNFGVVSCSSLAHGFFNAYAKLAERDDIDAIIHLGDYIYEYGSGEYGNVRAYEPPTEIITLAD